METFLQQQYIIYYLEKKNSNFISIALFILQGNFNSIDSCNAWRSKQKQNSIVLTKNHLKTQKCGYMSIWMEIAAKVSPPTNTKALD